MGVIVMGFKIKYPIKAQYLTAPSKRRSGTPMPRVGFIVAHDSGNDGSTAEGNVRYYQTSRNQLSASAHAFIDDDSIIECIPATTGTPEKAWHVLYDKPLDNQLFGDDANDIAIGVELCYSYQRGSINNAEAYKRYVWYLAYLCYKFKLDPTTKIVGHSKLDPGRKTDPENALSKMGKTFSQLIADVVAEYKACTAVVAVPVTPAPQPKPQTGGITMAQFEAWMKQAGIDALAELKAQGLINNPEQYQNTLDQPVPQWLFFLMLNRVAKK